MTDAVTRNAQIIELLRHRHSTSQWACFSELRAGTGYGPDREQRIDFFAINTWPSNGGQCIAYEIKVSRADFAREIDKPEKRMFAESVSTECYFAMPCGLVKPDEIPVGWGLLELAANGLQRTKLPTQRKFTPWPQWFAMSIARRAADPAPKIPAIIWRVAGREVTNDELIAIAGETQKRTIDGERSAIAHKAQAEITASPEYRNLTEIRAIVGRACGTLYPSADNVRKWLESERVSLLSPEERRVLRAARAAFDRLLALGDSQEGP